MNPMKAIRIEKVTLNMGAGDNHERVGSAKKVLAAITGKTVVVTKTKRRTTFGMPNRKDIGAKITIRGKESEELLKKLMPSVESRIKPGQFDATGNFCFGIKEYIHIPGITYDPDIGILGLDVAVTLERPGYRVKRRRKKSPVGKTHRITQQEAIEWATSFGFEVTDKEVERY